MLSIGGLVCAFLRQFPEIRRESYGYLFCHYPVGRSGVLPVRNECHVVRPGKACGQQAGSHSEKDDFQQVQKPFTRDGHHHCHSVLLCTDGHACRAGQLRHHAAEPDHWRSDGLQHWNHIDCVDSQSFGNRERQRLPAHAEAGVLLPHHCVGGCSHDYDSEAQSDERHRPHHGRLFRADDWHDADERFR